MSKNSSTNKAPFNPYVCLTIGVLAVSTGAIFARLAEAPALVIAAYRVGIASLVIAPVALAKARNELVNLSRHDFKLSVIAGSFLALHFATWISSLDYTSVANSVVLVNTNPLWVGLLSPLITKERIRFATVASITISVIGGIIIGMGDFRTDVKALWGDMLALSGGIFAALYLLLGRNLRRKLSLLSYIMVCYGSAAIVLWIIVVSLKMQIFGFETATWGWLWAMALVTQIIGHSSYNWALRWFSTHFIAVSLLGEPIGAVLLAYLLFDEGLTWPKIIGGGLVLSAICIAASGEGKK